MHWISTLTNLYANWVAPKNVVALTTQRTNGVSLSPFESNNLALHVNDNPEHVLANRQALQEELKLASSPEWLEQTHSTRCVVVENDNNRHADAAVTRETHRVLAIMTADCQPLLFCNKQGSEIAAVHAGWRGLADGIIENTLAAMQSNPDELLVWIGPSICGNCYEVGDDVRDYYQEKYPQSLSCFKPHGSKWLANLAALSGVILSNLSINSVFYSNKCTFEQKKEFYSYRREQQTGRMVSLIWFT